MELSIIIVNWNSKKVLQQCLDSIFAQTAGITFEVIIIDAGSFDGCERMLRNYPPTVHFIQNQTNVGFSEANNRAFEQSTGQFVLFLNPDTQVIGSAIYTMYSHLQSHPEVGIVGAKLLNTDGSLQTSCVQSMPTLANKLLDSDFLRAKWPHSKLWGISALFDEHTDPTEADAISGACLMMRSSLFRQVGGFSPEYFMYAEDIDLACKVRTAGYHNVYIPTATVVHHGGNSSAHAPTTFGTVMMSEATRRFFLKTRGRTYAETYRVGMFVASVFRLVLLITARACRHTMRGSTNSSVEKWRAILRWSLKREPLVDCYYAASTRTEH